MQNANLLSSLQAANMLGLSVDQVRKMISKKEMNTIQVSDRSPHVIPLGEVIKHTQHEVRKASMTFDEYADLDAMNASSLKKLSKSLNHYLCQDTEQTAPMMKGVALHDFVEHKFAGREFDNFYTYAPTVDKRTKAGKEILDQFMRQNSHLKILSESDYKDVVNMGNAILSNADFWKFLKNADVEEVILWNHEGIKAKARLDYSKKKEHVITDLKTCQDSSFKGFRSSVYRYLYHLQAQWYRIGYRAVHGTLPTFVFAAVENHPPYNTALYSLSDDLLDEAQDLINRAIDLYKRFIDGEMVCKGYHEGIMEIL